MHLLLLARQPQHNGSARVGQRCAAVQYFVPAFVRSGSKRELAIFGLMSAPASSGHCAPLALSRYVPQPDVSRCSKDCLIRSHRREREDFLGKFQAMVLAVLSRTGLHYTIDSLYPSSGADFFWRLAVFRSPISRV